MLEVVVPGWVPDSRLSLNGRLRTHWRVLGALRSEAKTMLTVALLAAQLAPVTGRARVAIDFVYPRRRRRDPDGLAGLAKPLLDALVDYGVLVDDSSEDIDLAVRALTERGTTETRIRISGVGHDTAPGGEPGAV